MEFSFSGLLAGFVFGVFGIFLFRQGKWEANMRRALLGLALMLYGYFVSDPWADWGIGFGLIALNFTPWFHD